MRLALLLCFLFGGKELIAQGHKHGHKKPAPSRTIVVVDAGHGGKDPGSHGEVRGVPVFEGVYVKDVALRLKRVLRSRGTPVFMTTWGCGNIQNTTADKILSASCVERFMFDSTQVQAGSAGLWKRAKYGNSVVRAHPKSRVIWISVHFDVVGDEDEVEGVRIISADTSSQLTHNLAKGFHEANRLRAVAPVVPSGDDGHGIRHLFVLGKRNHAQDKVLIELGNFKNAKDLYRIRDPNVRQIYAETIARATSLH